MNAHPGQTLAGCDFKRIVYLGRDRRGDSFWVTHYDRSWRKRGFAAAREFYNSLPMKRAPFS